jgi:hypothetical protein
VEMTTLQILKQKQSHFYRVIVLNAQKRKIDPNQVCAEMLINTFEGRSGHLEEIINSMMDEYFSRNWSMNR